MNSDALTFMRAVWHLQHALERTSKRMEDTLGVSGPQRFALRIIGVVPDIGPAALAAALHLHPSTVTGVIQRLEERGLVRRVRHARDGRRVHLRVTPAGARLNVPTAPGTVERSVRSLLRKTERARIAAVIRTLDELALSLIHQTGAPAPRVSRAQEPRRP